MPMVKDVDRQSGRVSFSTRVLESSPGDMLRMNPQDVYLTASEDDAILRRGRREFEETVAWRAIKRREKLVRVANGWEEEEAEDEEVRAAPGLPSKARCPPH